MFSVINHLSVNKHSRNGLLQAIKWLINAKCSFRCQLLDYLDTIKKTPDHINFANNNLKEDLMKTFVKSRPSIRIVIIFYLDTRVLYLQQCHNSMTNL